MERYKAVPENFLVGLHKALLDLDGIPQEWMKHALDDIIQEKSLPEINGELPDKKMVPVYFLEMLSKVFEEYLPRNAHRETLDHITKEGELIPLELTPGVTKKDLLEDMFPDGYSGIDFALPQQLVNIVHDVLDYNMCPDFVMDCRTNPWKPIPLTKKGREMLPRIYREVLNMDVPR